jgi:peptide/nickel transport system substrate-binding protein
MIYAGRRLASDGGGCADMSRLRRPRPPAWGAAVAIGAAIVTMLAAGAPAAAVSGAPKADPNATLRVGVNLVKSNTTGLDPRVSTGTSDITFLSALYAPLMKYSASKNRYTPYLAQSVTVTDPQTIKVVLRSNAMFDNGQPVTAADAKASIETTVRNQKAGKCVGCNAGLGLISPSVEVVDASTFVIHTTVPSLGVIYDLLIGRETFIVPANAGLDQNTKPVGDGPFKFVSASQGQQLELTKSSSFFDAPNVHLKGITFVNLVGGQPQTNALLAGDVDFINELDNNSYGAVKSKGFVASRTPDPYTYFFVDMCKSSGYFFSDLRIRQALSYGTDRVALARTVSQGSSPAAFEFWPVGSPQYVAGVAKQYKYDPSKAKALLKQAGVQPGTTVNLLVSTNSTPAFVPIGLVLKDEWSRIGLSVNIVPSTDIVGDWLTPSARGNPAKAPGSVFSLVRPGLQKLTRLFSPGAANNACGYNNPQLNQLITDLNSLAPSDPAAVAKWHQAVQIVANDVPVLPLMQGARLYAWSKKVGGIGPESFDDPFIYHWEDVFVRAGK